MLLVDDVTGSVELPTVTTVSISCGAFWKIKVPDLFSLCPRSVLAGGCPGPQEVVKLKAEQKQDGFSACCAAGC